jgi:hypothetical protein
MMRQLWPHSYSRLTEQSAGCASHVVGLAKERLMFADSASSWQALAFFRMPCLQMLSRNNHASHAAAGVPCAPSSNELAPSLLPEAE